MKRFGHLSNDLRFKNKREINNKNKGKMNIINWNERREDLIKFMRDGLTYEEIGKKYDLRPKTISNAVTKLGIRDFYNPRRIPKKYYKLTDEDKKGISQDVIKKIRGYKNLQYRNTRNFLISEFTKDINVSYPKGIILKEDIVEQYYITRKDKTLFNYDFSMLPKYISGTHEKFTIVVNEISPKTGKLVGEWKTSFKEFIVLKTENGVCQGILTKRFFSYTTEEFVELCKSKFGDAFGYEKVNYINLKTPIILKCNKCGEYFSQKPGDLIAGVGFGCPKCTMANVGVRKYLDFEEFKRRCIDKYGDIFDFSETMYRGSSNKVTVKNKITGEYITKYPDSFYSGTSLEDCTSLGETLISQWLLNNKISYIQHKTVHDEIFTRKTKNIIVDFVLTYNKQTYWIEYNGEQHYELLSNFYDKTEEDFIEQVKRDRSEKEYCKLHNITLIEIPRKYYKTYKKISNLLTKIIINNESTSIIKIPELNIKEEELL